MADALVAEIGPAATEGKTGRLLVEILQRIAFDFMMKRLDGGDGPGGDGPGGDGGGGEDLGAQEFMFLGRALKDLASAQKIDVDRELKDPPGRGPQGRRRRRQGRPETRADQGRGRRVEGRVPGPGMSDRQRVGDLPSLDLKDRLSGQPLLLGYQRRLLDTTAA